MHLNADFSQRALVRFEANDWIASLMPGVQRRMLDRIGEEVAQATSIVQFDPGSAFSPHIHDGDEGFQALDGTFQDEDGDFPTGFHVRIPPTSSQSGTGTRLPRRSRRATGTFAWASPGSTGRFALQGLDHMIAS